MKAILALTAALAVAGFAATARGEVVAEARLRPTQGSDVRGTVTFVQVGDKVRVTAYVSGLSPGAHGFHIHEKGDCSAPDAMSAGGHFNPGGTRHGHPLRGEHHAGDMPMLEAEAPCAIPTPGDRPTLLTAELSSVSLREGPTNIIGRAVVVNADWDDFMTQPTGNSNDARVACGVIVKQ